MLVMEDAEHWEMDRACESINGWIAIPMVRCGICAVSTLRMCFMHAEYHCFLVY